MNRERPFHCWAHRDPWDPFGMIRIMIGGRDEGGRIIRMEPVTFRAFPEDEAIAYAEERSAGLTIQKETAQSLMDQLWNLGIRPTEGHGSTGQLAATEAHLADMRALVFKSVPPRRAKSDL